MMGGSVLNPGPSLPNVTDAARQTFLPARLQVIRLGFGGRGTVEFGEGTTLYEFLEQVG